MARFSWVTRVRAPIDAVAAFHALPRVIRRLTPRVVPMTTHRMDALAEGSVSEFTLWFGPLPVRWTALHLGVDRHAGFTDIQIAGPFRSWIHHHGYEPDHGGWTRIVERIDYEHDGGWRGLLTRILFSRPMLYALFTYRSFVFRRALNAQSGHEAALPAEGG